MTRVLGIEGSANKVAVGIVSDDGSVLSNPRKTCVSIPRDNFIEVVLYATVCQSRIMLLVNVCSWAHLVIALWSL
jgi:hypothetical protein